MQIGAIGPVASLNKKTSYVAENEIGIGAHLRWFLSCFHRFFIGFSLILTGFSLVFHLKTVVIPGNTSAWRMCGLDQKTTVLYPHNITTEINSYFPRNSGSKFCGNVPMSRWHSTSSAPISRVDLFRQALSVTSRWGFAFQIDEFCVCVFNC